MSDRSVLQGRQKEGSGDSRGPSGNGKAPEWAPGDGAELGTEMVDLIIHHCPDGGLSWIYSRLNDNPGHMPLSERAAMIYFVIS